jgi:hypothetical protein
MSYGTPSSRLVRTSKPTASYISECHHCYSILLYFPIRSGHRSNYGRCSYATRSAPFRPFRSLQTGPEQKRATSLLPCSNQNRGSSSGPRIWISWYVADIRKICAAVTHFDPGLPFQRVLWPCLAIRGIPRTVDVMLCVETASITRRWSHWK